MLSEIMVLQPLEREWTLVTVIPSYDNQLLFTVHLTETTEYHHLHIYIVITGGYKGAPGTRTPFSVQFILISCSFQEKIGQIVLWIWRPPLENPGSGYASTTTTTLFNVWFKIRILNCYFYQIMEFVGSRLKRNFRT